MKLMVIDGNSLINRAFYGVHANLSTIDGQPTGAIYGFLNMLHRYLKEIKPQALSVTFDMKGPTFRHKQFDGYKAGRKAMPEDLVSQLPLLKEVLTALRIPYFSEEGWEADDLMGTFARISGEEGWETVLVTGDRDALQLITPQTSVLLLGNKQNVLYDPNQFDETYGFPPPHLVDLKALMGDASDNIPGIKGLGEKTVLPLIQVHHTIDSIFEKLQDPEETLSLKPAALKKMREGEESARLSYQLATILTSAPVSFSPQEQLLQEPDNEAAFALFTALELTKMIEYYKLSGDSTPFSPLPDYTCEEVTTFEQCQTLLKEWQGKSLALLPLPQLVGLSVYVGDMSQGKCYFFLERHLSDYGTFLKELFQGEYSLLVHESKQLHSELLQKGIFSENITFDTEVAAYLLAPDDREYSLETLSKRHLKVTPSPSEHYTDCESFSPLSDPTVAMDTWGNHTVLLFALQETLSKKLEEQGFSKLMEEIELPLCLVLAKMEREGVCVDKTLLLAYEEKLSVRLKELETLIHEEAGEEFNINSPSQLGVILFEKLELPAKKKTKTGYSTNVEVLEELRLTHPHLSILQHIMEQRQLSKLHSTYAKGLLKVLTPKGKIHTTFKNTVTATGRLSSTDPNLQNIPIRTPLGGELRHMFVAEEGMILIDADYSQIELRLLAHLSQDEAMIAAFLSGEDFHTQTASQVFHVPLHTVDATMRRAAKAVNFGIVYGISAFSLSQDIGVTVAEAKQYITRYFNTYPKLETFLSELVEEGKKVGYVSTSYGRRRPVPDLNSSNGNKRHAAERIAQNMPIQGTAADIMKLAMIGVDQLLENYPQATLVLQIHDEVLVQCPVDQQEELSQKIKEVMESVGTFAVPLLADTNFGKSWGDSH